MSEDNVSIICLAFYQSKNITINNIYLSLFELLQHIHKFSAIHYSLLVNLIFNLLYKQQSNVNSNVNYFARLHNDIRDMIINNSIQQHPIIDKIVTLCKIFTTICKLRGDVTTIRILCCDLLLYKSTVIVSILNTIISIWKDILVYDINNNKEDIVFKSFISVLQSFYKNQYNESKEIQTLNWPIIEIDTIIETTINNITNGNEDEFENVIISNTMITTHKGWAWSYNNYIVLKLWPLLNPKTNTEQLIIRVIKLIGQIIQSVLRVNNTNVIDELSHLGKRLDMILQYPACTYIYLL